MLHTDGHGYVHAIGIHTLHYVVGFVPIPPVVVFCAAFK